MDEPTISVLIPVYNTGHLALRAIDSALKQGGGVPSFEVVAVDDGSDDGTAQLLDAIREDDRLRIIHAEHDGVAEARNRLLDEAHGEYVFWLDSDDTICEYALEVTYGVLQRYHVDAVRIDFTRSGNTDILTGDQYMRALIPDRLKSYFAGMLAKRSLYDGLRFRRHCLIEDYELHPRIAERLTSIAIMHRVDLYIYTQARPGSLTTEYGLRKEGVHARTECYAERYERYRRKYRDECEALMGELADYLCAEYALDYAANNDQDMRDTAGVIDQYSEELFGCAYVPWYRRMELSAIMRRSRLYAVIHWMRGVKRALVGTRRSNRVLEKRSNDTGNKTEDNA